MSRPDYRVTQMAGKFGRLTVRGRAGTNGRGEALWNCSCECGNETVATGRDLRRGSRTSCGCIQHPPMTGRRFGRLTVLSRAENRLGGHTTWLCLCDCGQEKVLPARDLKSDAIRSCGCLHRETKHHPNVAAFAADPVGPEAAYWAGFILADGYVREKKWATFAVQLQEGDRDHLERMATYVCPTAGVRHAANRPSVGFSCCGQDTGRLIVALRRFGVVPGKSKGHPVPVLRESEIPHFIRGFFDGDGHVGIHGANHGRQHYPHWNLYGQGPWMRRVRELLLPIAGTSGSLSAHGNIFRLGYCGTAVPKILRFIAGEPYLSRKKATADLILRRVA